MSFVECNPNHCVTVRTMGESLIKQELKIKELQTRIEEFEDKNKLLADLNESLSEIIKDRGLE